MVLNELIYVAETNDNDSIQRFLKGMFEKKYFNFDLDSAYTHSFLANTPFKIEKLPYFLIVIFIFFHIFKRKSIFTKKCLLTIVGI